MNHHIRVLVAVALAVSFLSSVPIRAQTLNPSYLSEMPPPAKILSEIKGQDTEDTIERQMGAFIVLNKMIDDMAWGLEHRYLPTKIKPDELRIKDIYGHAYADLWHKAVNKELHLYDNDWELRAELLNKFFSQSFRDLYSKSNANKEARLDAYRQKNSGVVFGVAPSASQPNPECAAKGLDDLTCKFQTAMKGMIKTMGATEEAEVDAATPGLVLSGAYIGQNFSVLMFPGSSSWVYCDDVWLQTTYAIEQKGNQVVVNIENGRDPLALTLQPDIKTLTGSGQTVPIHGYAPGGGSAATAGIPGSTNEVTTIRQRELTPLEAKQYPDAVKNGQTYTVNETTTSTEYTMPVSPGPAPWRPKSAPCRVGVLKYQIDNSKRDVPDLLKDWFDEVPGLVQGLRMIGNYDGPGGASIKFFPEKAIVGCNATIVEHNYGVLVKDGKVFVQIFSHLGAETFTLRPDGILSGTGASVARYGKTKTGQQNSDSCTYGDLVPHGRSQTSVAANRNTTTPPAGRNTPRATSTSNALEPPVLTVSNGFIGQAANPLAGRELLVLKASFEEALRKAGFQDPATAPVKRSAVAIWAAACKAQSPMCKQGIDALQTFYVGKIRLDEAGTVRVSGLPKGNFWVLGLGAANGQHFVWDLPVEIKPGANSIALDPRNAKIIY
jgi:hypothetical protein